MPQERHIVSDDIIMLDYAELLDTDYVRCKLIYKGGTPPVMTNCTFNGCQFIFENEALNTIHFLAGIAHSDGGRELVLKQFLGINS